MGLGNYRPKGVPQLFRMQRGLHSWAAVPHLSRRSSSSRLCLRKWSAYSRLCAGSEPLDPVLPGARRTPPPQLSASESAALRAEAGGRLKYSAPRALWMAAGR